MMWREKEIVIIGLMLVLFVLALQNNRTMTGNVILDAVPGTAAADAMDGMAGDVAAIKNIIEEQSDQKKGQKEQKEDAFCEDECAPEGKTCAAGALTECNDFNGDGCLEVRKTACTNGCDETESVPHACRDAPLPAKVSQGELIKSRDTVLTDATCAGKLVGTIQWNPDGSLCRKSEFAETSGGLVKPLGCCSKFYYAVACTQNLGMIKRGPSAYSQFFVIGCYEP